ncbi:hypothetical protein J6590_056638 [Homalodisca vitripennis]|nr:hypothetical protein J6590_056638 [Homalodisca vitripennis]
MIGHDHLYKKQLTGNLSTVTCLAHRASFRVYSEERGIEIDQKIDIIKGYYELCLRNGPSTFSDDFHIFVKDGVYSGLVLGSEMVTISGSSLVSKLERNVSRNGICQCFTASGRLRMECIVRLFWAVKDGVFSALVLGSEMVTISGSSLVSKLERNIKDGVFSALVLGSEMVTISGSSLVSKLERNVSRNGICQCFTASGRLRMECSVRLFWAVKDGVYSGLVLGSEMVTISGSSLVSKLERNVLRNGICQCFTAGCRLRMECIVGLFWAVKDGVYSGLVLGSEMVTISGSSLVSKLERNVKDGVYSALVLGSEMVETVETRLRQAESRARQRRTSADDSLLAEMTLAEASCPPPHATLTAAHQSTTSARNSIDQPTSLSSLPVPHAVTPTPSADRRDCSFKNVLLIGDSHLRHASSKCVFKGAYLECCPGGKIVDIKNRLLNYVGLSLSVIYIHVGANNLRKGYRGGLGYNGGHGKREALHSMADLLFTVKTNFQNSKIFLDSVLIRRDIGYKALHDFNLQLELMCNNFDVEFVEGNTCVSRRDLTRDGVHFSRRGVTRLGSLFHC